MISLSTEVKVGDQPANEYENCESLGFEGVDPLYSGMDPY